MSIISWTSPSASERVLPTSAVTRVARSALYSVSSSPQRLTSAPRRGAGTSRQVTNASAAASMAASMAASSCSVVPTSSPPVIGLAMAVSPSRPASSTPHAFSAARTPSAMDAVVGKLVIGMPPGVLC